MKWLFTLLDLDEKRGGEKISFIRYYVQSSLPTIRISFLLAFSMFGIFGILDAYMAPESKYSIWFIRFCIVMPSLAGVFWISFSRKFIRYSQVILLSISLICGFGVLLMILSANTYEPAFRYYYSGLILMIIWTHGIMRLKSELALFSTFILILGYNASAVCTGQFDSAIDIATMINNNFFLVSSGIIGAFASYDTERIFRNDFVNKEIILAEKADLFTSRAQLQEMSAIKSKLLSIISHDLRGPLSSVKGILQLFSSGLISETELKNHSKRLEETVDGTSNLLDNLLSWSVLQLDGKLTKGQNFNLHKVVADIFSLVNLQAAKKNNQLINDIEPNLNLVADLSAMQLVLRNLVSNALKYTQDGHVRISACCNAETNEIKVLISDSGTGIPSAVAAELFIWEKRQSRIRAGTQSERGSGMGLMICKEFIEKQGGQIFFTTEEWKGTTFYFTIPYQNLTLADPIQSEQAEAK